MLNSTRLKIPSGTMVVYRDTPDDEFAEFPDQGIASVALVPPQFTLLSFVKAFPNNVVSCCFSAGTNWPDTREIFEEIERGLTAKHVVLLNFANVVDAESCLERLCRLGAVLA